MAGKIILKKQAEKRLLAGHPWIFAGEIASEQVSEGPGAIVDVFSSAQKFCGRGYWNPQSQIRVRLLTLKPETVDEDFFFQRIRQCWDYRKRIGYTDNCRLVFAEADQLPGLIVDKFGDIVVIQTLALGMDRWKSAIVAAIQDILHPAGIYERNDAPVRELEGLPQVKGFLSQPFPTTFQIRENGLSFWVDVANGQKTGYFLDQHMNRQAIAPFVKDAEILEAFCYTGSFTCHAAAFGARHVTAIDASADALQLARQNAALNGVATSCSFVEANAFDVLKQWAAEKRSYDVVMLDPPAFAKSRQQIQSAITGYKEINLRALKMIRPGGFLITSSCTNLIPADLFLQIIRQAAADAKRQIRQVLFHTQPPDHPIVWTIESTAYLKFLIVQVQ
ncbi:class I SAM-dependent rRNA methyltransferase [Thermoflavifilum thermophilum]|uniref:23S rRNA (Cytosine1962-C5)-methyltransferase n=1 Tax=Thermoflavifilum thermophilum TaxID=1393122 RepID=A0A1I7NER4_9BACT|nr:class I SAM-dependent rRNA methyltransferase [Thermoflavifilum thermophilum]SFV33155.1 23S rRNA (cytosine1962-C5)-methyltransferase [Thermoflavifilum thermophilum]